MHPEKGKIQIISRGKIVRGPVDVYLDFVSTRAEAEDRKLCARNLRLAIKILMLDVEDVCRILGVRKSEIELLLSGKQNFTSQKKYCVQHAYDLAMKYEAEARRYSMSDEIDRIIEIKTGRKRR